MKLVSILLLVLFSTPNGNRVWISPDQVVTVRPANDLCPQASTQITTSDGKLACVVEKPEDVVRILMGDVK